jgi:hypothetical protein
MSQPPKIAEIDFSVTIEDLLGPLGYSDPENVTPAIMEQLVAATERCSGVMTGKAIFSLSEFKPGSGCGAIEVGGKEIVDEELSGSLKGAKALAVAVCTVGPEIDKIIADGFDGGDYLEGMIADVVGNRAVEDVAHKCARLICAEAKELDLSTGSQISPGYGSWDTSGQRLVFEMLDPAPIGVSLNEQCMMSPKKSISFVAPLVEGEPQNVDRPPCHGCGFKNCSYRRK